jgi:hypothetical protein
VAVTGDRDGDGVDVDAYCRAVEAHLCRKNDGHLIRVSGPAFEMVRGWAEMGIPLGVTKSGIDRTFERYYAKGPRRRPVHITFCEADVLDAFDAWRRALGLSTVDATAAGPHAESPAEGASRPARSDSLPAHLDRVLHRLTMLRAGAAADRELDDALDSAVRAIDAERAHAKQARGDARAALLERLASLDDSLVEVARARLSPAVVAALERDADAELAPFRERMPRDAYATARRDSLARLVRSAAGLPLVRYDG